MSAHAKLGPSAAKRWMNCPGSTRLVEAVPDPGSLPAAQGTLCHDELAHRLTDGAQRGIGTREVVDGYEVEFTEEMDGWVAQVARWVKLYLELHPHAHLMVEQHSPVGHAFGHPDLLWGTADIVIVNDVEQELVVADAKFGFEEVECAGNEQVSLYAIGMLHQLGWDRFTSVELAILQPRNPEPEQTELLTIGEMQDRKRTYEAPVERAVRWGTADLVPSDDACHWCRAAAQCPALHAEAEVLADETFANPELLPAAQLLDLLDSANRVRLHLRKLEDFVLGQLAAGVQLPGWKRVLSNKHRQWNVSASDLKAAAELLGVDPEQLLTQRELLSPAQVEKKLKLKLPDAVASKPQGEPVLARESDEREALAPEFTPAYTEDAVAPTDE